MTEPVAPPVCYRHQDRETWIRCQRCDRPICPDCMKSAAVGFQCPNCVKEGARTTRSGRLPYGGMRVANPTLVTSVLIGLNIAVWLAITADGGNGSAIASKLAIVPNWTARVLHGDSNAQLVDGVAHGAWWQVLTSTFTHVEAFHIVLNMLALYMFGPPLEQILGRLRFLVLYLVARLTGSAAVMIFSNEHAMTVGASGAIFGLLGAMAVVAFKTGGDFRGLMTLLAINLVITFTVPMISWQGHVGGLVGGALVAAGIVYAPRKGRNVIQFTVAGLVLAAALGLTAIRAHDLGQAPYPGDLVPTAQSRQ